MDNNTVSKIIQSGLDCGADFVEIYQEETRHASVLFKDKKVEAARAGRDYGIGIRLLYGSEVLYGFTSDDEEAGLIRMVRQLAISRDQKTEDVQNNRRPLSWDLQAIPNNHPIKTDPCMVGQDQKLDLLIRADKSARAASSKIIQVSAAAADVVSNIAIYNSEGLAVKDKRTRARFSISATAGKGGDIFIAREAPGAMQGFEFFTGLDIEAYARQASERAECMLTAGYISGGKMPVVMGNGFGGVIFHEACGHPLETESVRRKASPFMDKMDKPIAHEKVTAIDDGTIPNGWGSLNIDDEGVPVQKTTLIQNGILKSFMSDRVANKEMGAPITGSSRRESYKYAPVSRMRNTYIAAGPDTYDDMISSVEEGLYAKKMGGGSVNPATGEFNFAVEEGYIIKNGKVSDPVRGATLIGKGHEILPLISMVGDDLALAAGMCGASSGLIPAAVGQPTLKVDNILVGGR